MPTEITPKTFAVELRDKDGNLRNRLEHVVSEVQWTWLARGGYGRATIKVEGDYLRFQPNADDDVRVYVPDGNGSAFLAYRGIVEKADPSVSSGNKGNIKVECNGYFSLLNRAVIHDAGATKDFESVEVSEIVSGLIDDFIVPSFPIIKGAIDGSSYAPDLISFKTTVKSALETLFNLVGSVQYGVDENLNFYWRNINENLTRRFFIGDKVTALSNRIDLMNIVNRIYFEGGTVNDVLFTRTGSSESSIEKYGLHEALISNGSITTSSVASRYISNILRQKAAPVRQQSFSLRNTNVRLEASLPIGAVALVDPEVAQSGEIYGTFVNGGSNKIYGTLEGGGSGQVYGGVAKFQVERIDYSLSPDDGRLDADVVLGNALAISESSAAIKTIENELDAVSQRQRA
jgi:hypothetical protein